MASGILSGSPGPLAGGPTSEMSGMLGDKKIINKILKINNGKMLYLLANSL